MVDLNLILSFLTGSKRELEMDNKIDEIYKRTCFDKNSAHVSSINDRNLKILLSSSGLKPPANRELGQLLPLDSDDQIEEFNWCPSEPARTGAFIELLKNNLSLPETIVIRDVHGTNVYEHSIISDEFTLSITGKTDALFTANVVPTLPNFLLARESIAGAEFKTHGEVSVNQSFRSAVTEFILLSLTSRYRTFQILTSGKLWYFFFLVQSNGFLQIEYEFAQNWVTGISRLRYLLRNLVIESSDEIHTQLNLPGGDVDDDQNQENFHHNDPSAPTNSNDSQVLMGGNANNASTSSSGNRDHVNSSDGYHAAATAGDANIDHLNFSCKMNDIMEHMEKKSLKAYEKANYLVSMMQFGKTWSLY